MRSPRQDLDEIDAQGLRRTMELVDGVEVVNFGSNDYLGLSRHPALEAAFAGGIEEFGAGSGSSRLISGTRLPHVEFEADLAGFKGTESALLFGSGYATATGAIPSIVGKGDIVILDKLCHACLIDGAKLSGATIRVFPHNDLEKLESRLRWARRKAGGTEARILVVTESVFSMDGDLAPLPEIVALKNEHDALLFVDEAHAFGIFGPEGRGLASETGCDREIDFQMGTLSKGAGLSGGYLCASRDWIDLVFNRARSLIYSTAPPPALAVAARKSLSLIRGPEGEELRNRLRANLERFAPAVGDVPPAPIVPVILGENEAALSASQALFRAGFYAPAIRFPSVPRGSARLRITISATHRPGEIDALKSALDQLTSS